MRVLVTGSSGRVGTVVAGAIRAAGHDVAGFDLVPGPATTHHGSIVDAPLVREAARGADAIVHLAALHAPHVGRVPPADFRAVNVEGTRHVLDAASAHGIRRVVYSSTTSVYGHALVPRDRAVWVTEALEPRPRDVYDETKLEAEALCRAWAADGAACVGLRFSRCFPEPPHLVAIYRAYRGVDARDVAAAHLLALAHPAAGFELFNISARPPFRPEDAEALLRDPVPVLRARIPGLEAVFAARGWPLPSTIDRVYAIDEAERRLGYRPRFNVEQLLAPEPPENL